MPAFFWARHEKLTTAGPSGYTGVIMKHPALSVLLLLVSCAPITGCVPATVTTTAYERPSNPVVDAAFVKPGVDFSRYSKLTTEGLQVYYPEDAGPPPDAEIQRIRSTFRDAFRRAISDSYPVVDYAGPDVLEVRAQLIDMAITGSMASYSASGRLRDLVARGELTFIMEVADSRSGEVLARAADRTTDITSVGDPASWREVEAAADHWARLFRDWLDRSLAASEAD